jgi:hypothetical protein
VRSVVLASIVLAACVDPVHEDAVAELGPETPDAEPSPNHRPGQPCLTCHGGKGPADLELSVGGTVFETRGGASPSVGATVTITDGTNETRTLTTSASGNFYAARADWDLAFPLNIVVASGATKRSMTTTVGRDGGCGFCHRGVGDATHMPGVFVRDK